MVKASLSWEQLLEFQLGSHTTNVGMTFLLHQRESTFEHCVRARTGTQVIKECVRVSESVKRVEQGGHYFVVAEIEGLRGRQEERHKWDTSLSTG